MKISVKFTDVTKMTYFTQELSLVLNGFVKIARHYLTMILNTVFYMEVFFPGSNRYKIKHKFLKYFENIIF